MVYSLPFFTKKFSKLFRRWFFLLISSTLFPFCLSLCQRKSPMSSNFTKICRKNGSFYVGDILLDPFETIRVVGGVEGVRDDLQFTVPGREV